MPLWQLGQLACSAARRPAQPRCREHKDCRGREPRAEALRLQAAAGVPPERWGMQSRVSGSQRRRPWKQWRAAVGSLPITQAPAVVPGAGARLLGQLPQEVMLHVVGLATCSMLAWAVREAATSIS